MFHDLDEHRCHAGIRDDMRYLKNAELANWLPHTRKVGLRPK